jgi:hypothetical protein
MASSPLSQEEIVKTRQAINQNRNPDGTVNLMRAARAMGIPRPTLQNRVRNYPAVTAKFITPELPSSSRSIDELVADKLEITRRAKNADEARDLIPIPLNIDGPFGLLIFGDPHVDDDGCDFETLARHRQIAIEHPYVVSASIGDHQNAWIGRLGRLFGEQNVTAKEAWKLVEWLVSPIHWLFLIGGNHDLWAGSGDPLDWIARQAGSLYEAHGVRMQLNHPCGAKTRIHCRHNFKGSSIYHVNHGPKREVYFGHRDHLIVAGHLHVGGDEGMVMPDGVCAQLVRVSGFKVVDHYAQELGLKKVPIHPSALIIIDPREPETSRARCWCAPTVEHGVKFLDTLRAEYEIGGSKKREKRGGGNR